MKCKYFMYLLLALLLGACSSDEPTPPTTTQGPSKDAFEKFVCDKTWKLKDITFVDSDNRTVDIQMLKSVIPVGSFDSPFGMAFSQDVISLAIVCEVCGMDHRGEHRYKYDDATGDVKFESNDHVVFHVESVNEKELVVCVMYGCFPQGLYDHIQDNSLLLGDEKDPGSHLRKTYEAIDADAAEAFWAQYTKFDH